MVETHIEDEFVNNVFGKIVPVHGMLMNLRDFDISHNVISSNYIVLMKSL